MSEDEGSITKHSSLTHRSPPPELDCYVENRRSSVALRTRTNKKAGTLLANFPTGAANLGALQVCIGSFAFLGSRDFINETDGVRRLGAASSQPRFEAKSSAFSRSVGRQAKARRRICATSARRRV